MTARRRSSPHILLGALLVVACAAAFAVTALRVDPLSAVLVVARSLPAGHRLSAGDLTVVRIVPDAVLGAVAEDERPSVIGRTLRLPVTAHMLLSQAMLGPVDWPPAGQSLVAVSVKAGRAPAGLAAGTGVLVLALPGEAGSGATSDDAMRQAQATVVSVGAADGTGTTTVSLLIRSADAVGIAGASGDVAVVVQSGGG